MTADMATVLQIIFWDNNQQGKILYPVDRLGLWRSGYRGSVSAPSW